MATLRELKGRIGSVASSGKITGAMKMISSAKMHKAEGVLKRLVPFRQCIKTILTSLLESDAAVESPLTEPHNDIRKIAVVVFGSDDGLCGAYNVNIFKEMLADLSKLRQEYGQSTEIEIIPIGKKIQRIAARIIAKDNSLAINIPQDIDSKSDGENVKNFAKGLQNRFLRGEIDMVRMVYMHFITAGRQVIDCSTYLPCSPESLTGKNETAPSSKPYLFEPNPAAIYAAALPMYLLSNLQQAFAENRASEQAARVMAMQSANDNAQKLLEQLQLEYNKLRQQAITSELLDIVGGQARD